MTAAALSGLELLATAVLVLDAGLRVQYANPAAASAFGLNRRALQQPFDALFPDSGDFQPRLRQALREERGFAAPDLVLAPLGREPLHLSCVVTPAELAGGELLLELLPIDMRLRMEREEQRVHQHEANRELIRNLAHEIKNPLGGLRGSAQLLERELDRPDLREYTQVIIKEADRLQALMDRLLTPTRRPRRASVNIHEVCERVRSLILAEFPQGIRLERDYDVSLPELDGDMEQLIQAVLNVVRNAAQAISRGKAGRPAPEGAIVLRTRVARDVTLAKRRHGLALELLVEDDGPGVLPELRERIFYPLVSGREGGSGLGLTLAQTFVQHHGGVIEWESQPGRTCFRIVLPLR